MLREKECNRGMRENIFMNEIRNIRKIESMEHVRNLILKIVKNVNGNNRGNVVGGDICKNPQGYTLEINTTTYIFQSMFLKSY